MPFNEKLPEWQALGTEPPDSKKQSGWSPSDKPPADYFNWFQNRTYKALKELQEKAQTNEILSTVKENYDADIKNYAVVKKLSADGTLKEKSELTSKDATTKRYGKRVITRYAFDGTTVKDTRTLTITYDANGDFLKEE